MVLCKELQLYTNSMTEQLLPLVALLHIHNFNCRQLLAHSPTHTRFYTIAMPTWAISRGRLVLTF